MYITGFRASVIILKTCVGKRIGTSSVKCLAHDCTWLVIWVFVYMCVFNRDERDALRLGLSPSDTCL